MTCTIWKHPLRVLHAEYKAAAAIQWPSYTGMATLVGTTPDGRLTLYYDASLGPQCLADCRGLLADAPRIMALNDIFFVIAGGQHNVIVFALGGATDGTGGADHMGCDFQTGQNIEVCWSQGSVPRMGALYEAELSECMMNGNLCGLSTGEALSRWCAADVSNNAMSDFISAPTWAQKGYPNWVDQTEGTDQNYPSIGCGMAFLSWVMSGAANGTKYGLAQVAQVMVALGDNGTLTQLWQRLTNVKGGSPWAAFLAACRAVAISGDDPFGAGFGGGVGQPVPPVPPLPPVPPPAPVYALELTVLFPLRRGHRYQFVPDRDVAPGKYGWVAETASRVVVTEV